MIQLSPRLKQVANYIQQYAPQDHRVLCDVGSDHAYLPTYLLQQNQLTKAIAGEVVEGPFKAAQKMKQTYSFGDQLSVRLGDGLAVIHPEDEVNIISICGMGGSLIRQILEEGKEAIASNTLLILQPNMASQAVRQWINDQKFSIIDEIIIKDHHRLYEIIVAIAQKPNQFLTEQEILFGPVNLKEKSDNFIDYWTKEQDKLKKVEQQMSQSSTVDPTKKEAIAQKIKQIQEVISNDA